MFINVDIIWNAFAADGGVSSLERSRWGPNPEEFQRRFDPELTNGEGPRRLRNLYFLYLLELRALAKAAPYIEQLDFYTGNISEDAEVYAAVHDLLHHVKYGVPLNIIITQLGSVKIYIYIYLYLYICVCVLYIHGNERGRRFLLDTWRFVNAFVLFLIFIFSPSSIWRGGREFISRFPRAIRDSRLLLGFWFEFLPIFANFCQFWPILGIGWDSFRRIELRREWLVIVLFVWVFYFEQILQAAL